MDNASVQIRRCQQSPDLTFIHTNALISSPSQQVRHRWFHGIDARNHHQGKHQHVDDN
jgi:hypothetical protein